ncbi:MAG: histidinol dehydrogenase [Bacteroidota bacterium]
MKTAKYPKKEALTELLTRPVIDQEDLSTVVNDVLQKVKHGGDELVRALTEKFDQVRLDDFLVTEKEKATARELVSKELKDAIRAAALNIERFHSAQREDFTPVETMPGVRCWRKSVPIEKVGLYIPGGTAPLFSTVLMLAIPARLAGCQEVVLCTPPGKDGLVNPAILVAAEVAGVAKIFKVGGSQAIAALAYGTESIPKVDKIFGPGNRYVTAAKMLVQRDGVAIDMPAGPSEVLVFADQSAVPAFVASDLLSQAEHDVDSQVVLLTTNEKMLDEVKNAVEQQVANLPRQKMLQAALSHSVAILLEDEQEAIDAINEYAPEHLILACENAGRVASQVINAGSVFLGNFTPESAGDYASGTNHTLPTSGFARSYSGVSLDSFLKKITFQQITKAGLQTLGPIIMTMAEAEQLPAHAKAVELRLKY